MPFFPAFLEFLGTTEMLVIAVVALIIFGPRRLPEIGRMVGKGLAEFKRASEDFKRTWEREVEIDRIERDLRADLSDVSAATNAPVWPQESASADAWSARTIARTGAAAADESAAAAEGVQSDSATPGDDPRPAQPAGQETPQKHDWL
jgi:Tat protein translocase TatB subunit